MDSRKADNLFVFVMAVVASVSLAYLLFGGK